MARVWGLGFRVELEVCAALLVVLVRYLKILNPISPKPKP